MLRKFTLVAAIAMTVGLYGCDGGGPATPASNHNSSGGCPTQSCNGGNPGNPPGPEKPTNLTYSQPEPIYIVGEKIQTNVPSSQGGTPTQYEIDPISLPDGLHFDTTTGHIDGTPTAPLTSPATYTVTAQNNAGNTSTKIKIRIAKHNSVIPLDGMNFEHTGAITVPLQNGDVLVAGGYGGSGAPTTNAEIYEAQQDQWVPVRAMHYPHINGVGTLLKDGRVLVAGDELGNTDEQKSAEIYDPKQNSWTVVDKMSTARARFTAAVLQSGKVLVSGGYNAASKSLASTEIFDPTAPSGSQWKPGVALPGKATFASSVTLYNGDVMVTGGQNLDSPPKTSAKTIITVDGNSQVPRVYDLNVSRANAVAVAINSLSGSEGRGALIAGGLQQTGTPPNSVLNSIERLSYNTTTQEWNWATLPTTMSAPRYHAMITTLSNGKIMIAGGYSSTSSRATANTSTDIVDPTNDSVTHGPAMTSPRADASMATLRNGEVLIAGGATTTAGRMTYGSKSAELYIP